ncbi:uncharacterized protein MKK02DRAFT_39934 [Dioszegia hungarica]|uniref:Uncharacterized protein n=1 Tax=Dioszegia hungarica TaxID=4972 RepID=A0AA38LXA0_9TREE|nr:uncharacterized protein MKK02DRAFT_39934 [Dioszegia hungarica]KAI9639612.1 hypothetical protein MKK02DRAFT_39934 [Dioszegia hungarica]
MADRLDIQPGGPAARRVYLTSELFRLVLDHLGVGGSVPLLRLEKASIASAAAVVYRSVHVRDMKRFSRSNPTHCIYLDAVRVLDRSYIPPEFAVLCARQLSVEVPRTPTRFSPKTALNSFRLAQKKFPHVRSVLLKHRSDDRDDVYDMHRIPGSDRFNV